jgi:hypothetical protein
MAATADTGDPLDKVFTADNELEPADFDAWDTNVPEPEDTDWGLPEEEAVAGIPVDPECLEAILSHMNAWMAGSVGAYSGAESLGEEFINLQGQIAGNVESIQSNAPSAAAGTMSAYDIGELRLLVQEDGPSLDILMSNPNGVAIVTTINNILNGQPCSSQTQSGVIDVD